MDEKFLPLGIQDFQDMIERNFIYVDKTKDIHELVRAPKAFYFLSRPRRFGKSLLVSTLGYLFEGRQDLFKGLWIAEQTNWQWENHPVVKVDFNGINSKTPSLLEKSLENLVIAIGKKYQISLQSIMIPDSFVELIIKLQEKYRKDVIVLIDEYDKPLINHLGKSENDLKIAKENRDVLKQFFGVLKEQDVSGALRMVFITGVSRFSRVSIFSDLNNLDDLSMQPQFSGMLGYTEDEMEKYFQYYIRKISGTQTIPYEQCKDQLQTWYNGYQFTHKGKKVYNPFSVLNALKKAEFKNYWFETGTPSFLVNLIKENNYPIPEIENLNLHEHSFTTYDLDNLRLEALLFQTGYITIKKFDGIFYSLGYPNQEVKTSFTDYIYSSLVEIRSPSLKDRYRLIAVFLQQQKIEEFIDVVNSILASIPYTHIARQDESYYHTIFYLMVSAAGVLVQTEVLTSIGRIDIAAEFPDKVYIIELKCNQTADQAIKQIKEKKYSNKYKALDRDIYLIGINFDTSERAVTDWKLEKIAK
ncbi:ATP-binding protein [candidate division KSB1 bacterium]|nr:ATP-binding protein [candidate division KSB1 bacterium]MBL7092395.1 ATP-binding protein [candidate division KSB1 bacterium]